MAHDEVQVRFTQAEAMVLFEWLARADDAELLPINHPAEQKTLWLLEGQLEKQLDVFAPNYKQLIEEARAQVDASH